MSASFNLAIGPMSREVVEAVFQYSHNMRLPLALIASKNQVDFGGGYVEGWSTYEYMQFVQAMQVVYPSASITVCRDHCGPGFNGIYDIDDVMETIRVDIEQGFDLIHIDFCKMPGTPGHQREMAARAIQFAQGLKSGIRFEIGTDEITGEIASLDRLSADIEFFQNVCQPEFYVINTGSRTMENRQVGIFSTNRVQAAAEVVHGHGMKVKEHNADFLNPGEIQIRRGMVDALNIAPELGVQQTRFMLHEAERLGMPTHDWVRLIWQEKKWEKWLLEETKPHLMQETCIHAGGHYHFNTKECGQIRKDIYKAGGVGKDKFVAVLMLVIDRYVKGMSR